MKVTAAMLSDHATVREGLLHVLGGGINQLIRDPLPAPLGAMLALMLQPDSLDDLLETHNLEVTIKHSRAEGDDQVAKAVMTLRNSAPAPGALTPVAVVVPLQGVPITQTGTHDITVSLDGEQCATIEFIVVKAADAQASLGRIWAGRSDATDAGRSPQETRPASGKFVLKKGSSGKYHFNLVADSGQVIATSQTYDSKQDALQAIDSARLNASDAPVEDSTKE